MPVIEKLQRASFRGVEFLVESETKQGGKKTVTHEFVNSNQRFTEELGELPPVININAVVHGETAIDQRFNLERVLNLPGTGTLVHPVYGILENVKSTTYSVNSAQTGIGEFKFSIQFETSESNVTAAPTTITNSAVSKAAEDARSALNSALESSFINPEFPKVSDTSGSTLDDIYEEVFNQVSSVTNAVQTKISEFTRVVENGRSSVFSIVQQATTVKTSIQDLYLAAINVVNTPSDLLDAWSNLTDFGFLDTQGKTNTVPRQNEENNRSILNEHTRVNALINAFEAAVYTNFQTDVELSNAQQILNDAYNTQIEQFRETVSSEVNSLAANPNVRQTISELRNLSRQVFDEKEQNIWRVVTIDPGTTSMLLTSYRYYGNIDNLNLIIGLNDDINVANFKTPITAISR
jgi:prophage DNA circulation protein